VPGAVLRQHRLLLWCMQFLAVLGLLDLFPYWELYPVLNTADVLLSKWVTGVLDAGLLWLLEDYPWLLGNWWSLPLCGDLGSCPKDQEAKRMQGVSCLLVHEPLNSFGKSLVVCALERFFFHLEGCANE